MEQEETHRKFKCSILKPNKARKQLNSILGNLLCFVLSKSKTFGSTSFLVTRYVQVYYTTYLNKNLIQNPFRDLFIQVTYLRKIQLKN
jgi:hypothetical protein